MTSSLDDAVSVLSSLKEESDVSRRFKEKAEHIIFLLSHQDRVAVEKALLELEELEEFDLPVYHRTQVWDVISLLESVERK